MEVAPILSGKVFFSCGSNLNEWRKNAPHLFSTFAPLLSPSFTIALPFPMAAITTASLVPRTDLVSDRDLENQEWADSTKNPLDHSESY